MVPDAYYPVEVLIERRPVDSLADELVRDATEGVAGTGVRIGILGEIGTDKPWVTPAEERVFRAVARCARRTGLAISTHAVMSDVGAAQLTVLLEEGVDPARVVIGHSDSYPVLAHYLALIERGASIDSTSWACPRSPGEARRGAHHRPAAGAAPPGHVDRVLLSLDVCHNSQLRRYEGNGYTYLQDSFLPRLRERGVSRAEIDRMTIDNPRRILTIG